MSVVRRFSREENGVTLKFVANSDVIQADGHRGSYDSRPRVINFKRGR